MEELAKLPISWYGGADLSKMHDLTAAALYGTLKGYKKPNGETADVDIIISHAWFPVVAAHQKADEDGIPLFGWKDDGGLISAQSNRKPCGVVTGSLDSESWALKSSGGP